MKYEIQQMLTQGVGAIVNTSSTAGLVGAQGLTPYTASKHAVMGLTRSAALDYAKQVHVDRINEDIEGGIQSGVTTTPALFINENRYTGHWNTTELMAAMIAASH